MPDDYVSQLSAAICLYLDLEPAEVTPSTRLGDDLLLDSLDILSILDEISDAVGLTLEIDVELLDDDVTLTSITVDQFAAALRPY